MAQMTVYGADWCGDTQRLLRKLQQSGVDFEYVDIDQDKEAEALVIQANGGKRKIPVVKIGAERLINPSVDEAVAAIESHVRRGSHRRAS